MSRARPFIRECPDNVAGESQETAETAGFDRYLARYVADREQFFSISRSVSVTEMAATLAHELNQPIGAITNLLEVARTSLHQQPQASDAVLEALRRAGEQARFAADIVARVRDFTEARSPQVMPCDLRTVVARTIDLMDWVFRTEVVQLDRPKADTALMVLGDETLLQQVIANLLRNAVDALRGGGISQRRIDVGLQSQGATVVLTVADTGNGLREDSQDALYVPFTTQKRHGMGVGLSICRSFVEMHRGKLWLGNNAAGGCTAYVKLPLHIDDADHCGKSHPHDPSATATAVAEVEP